MTPGPRLIDGQALYNGDALEVLRGLPDESFHCAVTSPPFYGLRDYGTGTWEGGDEGCDHAVRSDPRIKSSALGGGKGTTGHQREGFKDTCGKCGALRVDQQIGLEETPEQWVDKLVAVFREVRRVLRKDGTLWLEVGDSYANPGHYKGNPGSVGNIGEPQVTKHEQAKAYSKSPEGYKNKDLIGAPWLLAFALRADGWYLRSEIIWSKPNPMPESCQDRPTTSHSRIFLLTRSPRYFFDQEAVREPHNDATGRVPRGTGRGFVEQDRPEAAVRSRFSGNVEGREYNPAGRNIRSVWNIATEPFPDAHFATFPQALVRRCVLAGTSERGCCPDCGAPWEREVERAHDAEGRTTNGQKQRSAERRGFDVRMVKRTSTTGWRPSCECAGRLEVIEVEVPRARLGVPPGGWMTGEGGHDVVRYSDGGLREADADPGDLPETVTERVTVYHPERENPPVSCSVLDPFAGAGTVAVAARELGRRSAGIDLNAEYLEMAARRLGDAQAIQDHALAQDAPAQLVLGAAAPD